jgi:hypothetical protein
MTHGRESICAYFYERTAGEADHQHRATEDAHAARRGSDRDAARLMRDIIASHGDRARTAHDVTATTEHEHLPEPLRSLADRRSKAAVRRRRESSTWHEHTQTGTERRKEQQVSRTSNLDHGLEL